jgi:hypothetical protein
VSAAGARRNRAIGNLVARLVHRDDLVTAIAIPVAGKFAGDLFGPDRSDRAPLKDFSFGVVERVRMVSYVKEEAGHLVLPRNSRPASQLARILSTFIELRVGNCKSIL